jgi:hypothetical protein
MRLVNLKLASMVAAAAGFACSAGRVAASPSILDQALLGMVSERAEIVSALMPGLPASFLVMTRNNTTDLTDFQSLAGVDPSRVTEHVLLVAGMGPMGHLSAHVLLADGQFNFRNIFKAALSNGAGLMDFEGFSVLVLQPLDRNRDVAPEVRWLIVIDGKIVVFGSVAMVQEALRRYLGRQSPNVILRGSLTHLRADDQSWSIVVPSVREIEMVRDSLAPLDADLANPTHAAEGLVLGIHFGRVVEVEYENEREWQAAPGVPTDSPELGQAIQHAKPGGVRGFRFRNRDTPEHHVIKVSRQQYEAWIADQTPLPGEPAPHAEQHLAKP